MTLSAAELGLADLDFTPWPAADVERNRAAGLWRGQTFTALLRNRAEEHSERIAVVGSRQVSYGELYAKSESLARGFSELGLRRGDRVIVQLPNTPEFFEICFALFRLGALPVMAQAAHRAHEITALCELTGATAWVIADEHDGFDYRSLARSVLPQLSRRPRVVVAGRADEFVPLLSVEAKSDASSLPDPNASDVALLLLSGGTTGTSKLIPRTHDDYVSAVQRAIELCALTKESVYLAVLPVSHSFPLSSPGTFGTFCTGGKVVLATRPDPSTAFPLIARERVTITSVVPSLLMLWTEALRHRKDDLSSLRVLQVGGARLPETLARKSLATFDCKLQQVFGMAEGFLCFTRLDDAEDVVATSQGRPASYADEYQIVDERDEPVKEGEVGQLLARGPTTFRGYYRAGAHNQTAFTADGFYRTGDLVRKLPHGNLVVEGRCKEQINRGGEKIAPAEVEEALLMHPRVREVAVVGIPDRMMGERSWAFVCASEEVSPADLQAFLAAKGLASYKRPDQYRFVEDLPKTPVGKTDKAHLRRIALAPAGPLP